MDIKHLEIGFLVPKEIKIETVFGTAKLYVKTELTDGRSKWVKWQPRIPTVNFKNLNLRLGNWALDSAEGEKRSKRERERPKI